MNVTFFKNLGDTKTPHYRDINRVFELIKSGGKHGEIVDRIRTTRDKEERERLKRSLPITLFSGKFKARRADALEEYNKLVVLDLDNLKNVDVRRFELEQLPFVYAVWVSPSGNGLKVLVRVLTDNHAAHFAALSKEIKGVDPSGKDICRATFLSRDEKIFVNPQSTVYDKVLIPSFTDEQKYENLKKWLENKGSYFVNGNRNSFITKLSSAANRFGVDKEFLKARLEEEFLRGSDFSRREMEVTVNGIYDRYRDQFHSVEAEEIWTDEKITQVLSDSIKTSDVIYLNDVREDLLKDYDVGTQKGETTYFPQFDKHYRWQRGDLNVLTGVGNFGKSAWQKQMDLIRSVKEGKKFAYFSPEEVPPLFWYREFIRSYVGKPVEREDPARMTRAEYERAMEFVREHFFFIYPPAAPTPEYILERFAEVTIKHGIDGVVVDPYNGMIHNANKREDIFLAEQLITFERFAQNQQVYLTIIAHPAKTPVQEDGNYRRPTPYDLLGGSTWNARATNILVYHRPYYNTNPTDPTCEITSCKIKRQMLSGTPGTVGWTYDRRRGRFYESNFNPLEKP